MSGYPRRPIPSVAVVRRHFSTDHVEDVAGAVRQELERVGMARRIEPGRRVAITAGSRGVASIATVIRTIVDEVKRLNGRPFIVPAMGSHGGATAGGQLELIAEFGITQETMGVPILSSMDTVEIGMTPHGATVHMDRNAYEADAIIAVNRVKAHTGFRAPIESGVCKMIGVGLGKQRGAESLHNHGLATNIPEAARIAVETGKIALGVAIVENPHHQPYRIVASPPELIHDTDRELLSISNRLLPRIPFDDLDVLVLDWIGKNISGAGIDRNIIGMWRRTLEPPFIPMYRRVVVLDVTPESHGNCMGIGMADFTTRKLVSRFDPRKTYLNSLTSNNPSVARIPITLETDVEAVEVALRSGNPEGREPSLVRVKSTLDLGEFFVTAGLLEQLEGNPEYEIVRGLGPMPRDKNGNLLWE